MFSPLARVAALLLLLYCVKADSDGDANSIWLPQLLKLNSLLTERINQTLPQYANQSDPEPYQRLSQALQLPLAQLAEKIRTYNAYGRQREQLNASRDNRDRQGFGRLLQLLQQLGINDNFTNSVLRTLLMDAMQLLNFKMKLLDSSSMMSSMNSTMAANKAKDLWNAIFDLL